MLVVEDHIAALHPSILNVVAHHVEGVTVRDEERRVLARLEGATDVVDAENAGRGKGQCADRLLVLEAIGHGRAGEEGQVPRVHFGHAALPLEAVLDTLVLEELGQLVGQIDVVLGEARHRVGPLDHHRDVVLAQGVGQHPAVHPANQHDPVEVLGPLESDDLRNLLGIVGVDVERRRPGRLSIAVHEQALHRLHAEVALGRFSLGIGPRPRKEVPDFVELLVVGLALAELCPAILEMLVVGGRPVEVDAVVGPHHGVLPIPSVELDHGA